MLILRVQFQCVAPVLRAEAFAGIQCTNVLEYNVLTTQYAVNEYLGEFIISRNTTGKFSQTKELATTHIAAECRLHHRAIGKGGRKL